MWKKKNLISSEISGLRIRNLWSTEFWVKWTQGRTYIGVEIEVKSIWPKKRVSFISIFNSFAERDRVCIYIEFKVYSVHENPIFNSSETEWRMSIKMVALMANGDDNIHIRKSLSKAQAYVATKNTQKDNLLYCHKQTIKVKFPITFCALCSW